MHTRVCMYAYVHACMCVWCKHNLPTCPEESTNWSQEPPLPCLFNTAPCGDVIRFTVHERPLKGLKVDPDPGKGSNRLAGELGVSAPSKGVCPVLDSEMGPICQVPYGIWMPSVALLFPGDPVTRMAFSPPSGSSLGAAAHSHQAGWHCGLLFSNS